MDKTTALTLLDSIEHWHRLYLGTEYKDEEPFADSCALCGRFLESEYDDATEELESVCYGCPVFEETGQHVCLGTPWQQACRAWRTPDFPAAALKEISFLVDLLPGPGELHEGAEPSRVPSQDGAECNA